MANVIFSTAYDLLPDLMREQRVRAGLSQRALAKRMNRSASHIHMIEARQRRVEVVEFCRYLDAVGADPVSTLQALRTRLSR